MVHSLSLISGGRTGDRAEHPVQAPTRWRDDLDRAALPPTPALSAGQRRVLVACLGLFADRGFQASTTREIAAAAGMQSPSLYAHFPSKTAMLDALVVLGLEHENALLLRALVGGGGTPAEQLAALVRAHVLGHCEFAQLRTVTVRERPYVSADAVQAGWALIVQSKALTVAVLRRGIEVGDFRVDDVEATFGALSSLGTSVSTTYPYSPHLVAEQLAGRYAAIALRIVGVVDDAQAPVPPSTTEPTS